MTPDQRFHDRHLTATREDSSLAEEAVASGWRFEDAARALRQLCEVLDGIIRELPRHAAQDRRDLLELQWSIKAVEEALRRTGARYRQWVRRHLEARRRDLPAVVARRAKPPPQRRLARARQEIAAAIEARRTRRAAQASEP